MNIQSIVIGAIFGVSCFIGFTANRFVNAKIANDTTIAHDTRRIADALDALAVVRPGKFRKEAKEARCEKSSGEVCK